MYRTTLLTTTFAALAMGACVPTQEPSADAPPPFPAGVHAAAVVTLKAGPALSVPVVLVNPTNEVWKYLVVGSAVSGLEHTLSRGGKRVTPAVTPGPGLNTKYTPAELPAGGRIRISQRLHYPALEPGEYDLVLRYEVHAGSTVNLKYGVTPVRFEQHMVLVLTP